MNGWRDRDDEPAGGPLEEPVPVTDALDRVLRSLRGGAGRRAVGGVFGQWEQTVGAALAAHARPVRLEHGTLLVEVDDPAWATHVRFLADDLCRRVGDVAGVPIDHVDVRVARGGSAGR